MSPTTFLLALAVLFFWPVPAMAVQVHGAPEGLYVHQMAHIFFAASLVFFLLLMRFRPIGYGKPWRWFKISLLLFLAWNIDTFMVHWLSVRMPEHFLKTGETLADDCIVMPAGLELFVYYLGRFDHLLCVPAMWYLMRALRGFCIDAEKRLQSPVSAREKL